jgi:hypothetical protein
MTKIAGSGSASESGSINQRHGSADPDPDPPQNVMDQQHCLCCGTGTAGTITFCLNESEPECITVPDLDPDPT